jgi:AcrR family transcriptional regulator
MSPAPSRTSRDAITIAARSILEQDGLDAVTMQAVAECVGVRAPSLYKHVAHRDALIRAVSDDVAGDLAAVLGSGRTGARDAGRRLRVIAERYRTFVRRNPAGYALLFAGLDPGQRTSDEALAALGEPIVAVMASIVGEEGALDAARTFTAWAHGFVSLEVSGGFRLGGDVDAAYARGIDVILSGLSGPANPPSG